MSIRDEIAAKHAKVAAWLDEKNLDGVLLNKRWNFSWYTSGSHNHISYANENGAAWLWVTREGATVLTTNIEAERFVGEDLVGKGIGVEHYPWHDSAARLACFRETLAGKRVAADAAPEGLDLPALAGDFDLLRWSLTSEEIERYRQLCVDVSTSLSDVAHAAEPGMTENDLAGMLEATLYHRGILPWLALVAGEGRVAKYRHPLPTPAKVDKYCMLVTCAERDGLICPCTRFFSFGKLSDELARKQRAVVQVDAAMIHATRVGATLGEVLQAGIDAYAATGFPEQWQLHHQGGSCGYRTRDRVATPGDDTAIVANQAFAWNPSIAGVKTEDTTLCTSDGPEILSLIDGWPVFEVEIDGAIYERPDVLIR